MLYRDFGNTGYKISALGFGAMRLPIQENKENPGRTDDLEEAAAILRYGIDKGINYIDTAYGYCHGRSEYAVGMALKDGWRKKVALATKLPMWDIKSQDDFKRILPEQLKKLDTDYIDFYHFHALGKEKFDGAVRPFKLIELAEKYKDEGLIKHLSFSFHDADPNAMLEIIDTGAFSSVLCQFNLLDRTNLDGIRYAAEKGMGVVIMGPVGGGRLAFKGGVFEDAVGGKISTPELAIRFVLSTPGVSCALSGMGNKEMVDDNAKVASIDALLSEKELAAIDKVTEECAELRNLYCTGCGYCAPVCPKKVAIPQCLESLIYKNVYHMDQMARKKYADIGNTAWDKESKKASACINCGACEKKCPQNIPIREHLRECVSVFGE